MFLLKHLCPRTLFSRTSPYSTSTALCSTSSPSHLTYSHPHSRNVSVKVWWDVDTCTVPLGVNMFRVTEAIASAIKASGIKGPIEIKAFGDSFQLSKTNQWVLTNTGVNYSADTCLSTDLKDWVLKNPAPAHLFLISDDIKFEEILSRTRSAKYNILLSSNKSSVLLKYATIMWGWDALVRGENLTTRYFNHPPHDFWYDRYEGLLDDPSTTIIESPVIRNMNWCDDVFWRDVQTLMNSDIGSFIITQSSTREDITYYLQKYGPSVLRSVTKSDVRFMVDMLIIDKKLLVETVELVKPFKRSEEFEKAYAHAGELEKEKEGSLDAAEELEKAHAHAGELEKQEEIMKSEN